MPQEYVHGYSERESERLYDQAGALADLLHSDTRYPPGSKVLEAGCGVGAQTKILARNNPHSLITSVDISQESVSKARALVEGEGGRNVTFQVANIFDLPFEDGEFDHIFVCFVLEHLRDPLNALKCLSRVLGDRGTMTVIEGDHGSAYFHPDSAEAQKAIDCLVRLQAGSGGDPKIGRRLYPLLIEAGFREVRVTPRVVYADSSRPELVEDFTRNTFSAMVEEVGEQALSHGMIDEDTWRKGVADLYRTAEADGTFSYTFFKAVAKKRGATPVDERSGPELE